MRKKVAAGRAGLALIVLHFDASIAVVQTISPAAATETTTPAARGPGIAFGPDHMLTANVGLGSNYCLGGLSQTDRKLLFRLDPTCCTATASPFARSLTQKVFI